MISDYYEVFKARMTADGNTYKQQIEKSAQRNFDRYLSETPTSEIVTIDNIEYTVAIVENRQDEFRLSKQMFSSIENNFPVGSLVFWDNHSPSSVPENYWIIWKKQLNSIKDHNVDYISRCNHLLKWIDENGIRHEQYIYEFSSKESMVRATFKSRVKEIIASEPNKFMEIIMPYTNNIKREQRFIIDDEAWYVIEEDASSAEGILYLTLGEDKKDLQKDSLISEGDEEDLANYTEENKNYITISSTSPVVEYNTNYVIIPYYYEDGKFMDNTVFIFEDGESSVVDKTYEKLYTENSSIIVRVANRKEIETKVEVSVTTEPVESIVYEMTGNNSIGWGKTAEYTVYKQENGIVSKVTNVNFVISDETLATLDIEDGVCYMKANSKRKVGEVILTAVFDTESIAKTIKITSLW